MSLLFRCAVAFILLSLISPNVRAADDPAAARRATLDRFVGLRKERPGDGLLVFYEAIVRIGLGERDEGFKLLQSLKGRKLGLVPAPDAGFDSVWNDPEFQKIRKEFADEEPKTADSPMAFRLKDPKLIPEGIAYDDSTKRFFLGSISQRKIIVTDEKGEVRDFSGPEDKLDCILGLTVDKNRTYLYAVSTNGFEDSAKTARRNAVVCYDLKTSQLTDRFAASDAMQLNDLTVANDGTVYATDSASGTVFRKRADEKQLSRLGDMGALRGANGIALAADGPFRR